jgi:hypothetical protein
MGIARRGGFRTLVPAAVVREGFRDVAAVHVVHNGELFIVLVIDAGMRAHVSHSTLGATLRVLRVLRVHPGTGVPTNKTRIAPTIARRGT